MGINKDVLDTPPTKEWLDAECAKIDAAVDDFAARMKARLHDKAGAGWTGWDDPQFAERAYLDMLGHAAGVKFARGQEVDIANYAMFLFRFNGGVAA